MVEHSGGDAILRRPMVQRRVGLSRSEIYRRVARGAFPRPVRLGPNSIGWLSSEIDAWISLRIAESREEAE